MSKITEIMNGGSNNRPVGKTVQFWADCQHCDAEVEEVEYFPNEGAIVFTCPECHNKSMLEGVWMAL